MKPPGPEPDPVLVLKLVAAALAEDRAGNDITTAALVPPDQRGYATIIAKAEGVLAGLPVARATFAAVDAALSWRPERADGDPLSPGDAVARVEGALASILRAERVALNFLSHLSGVATAAHQVVRAIEGTGCRLRDTRKTIPGLRVLQKYAVRTGGGTNHRLDLAGGVLIKDNHLAALRARGLGIPDAVRLARQANPGAKIEIEVTDLEMARAALAAGADELLLDNMALPLMRDAVRLAAAHDPRPLLEASGGITIENARRVAETGVDFISMGAITHSAQALDMSLEVEVGG
ncbi:MAG: carboxylating nicotinate-nucleotide diphosphorylase [Dehalococcoidia bacterium]|nr:carboxylating nicotinate-nucleotide diphosphorylase [Dehalococcoidia bacterium]